MRKKTTTRKERGAFFGGMIAGQENKERNKIKQSFRGRNNGPLSLVFICWENPRRSGISLFPERPRF